MLYIQREATRICQNCSSKTTQCFPFANTYKAMNRSHWTCCRKPLRGC